MKYSVAVNGRTFEVEIRGDEVLLDGRRADARLTGIPATPLRHLVLGAQSRTFALSRDGDHWLVQWGGERVAVKVVDERTRRLQAMAVPPSSGSGETDVRAPMPGLVLRLEVEVGQRVDTGTGLLVLEAMKMENEITARGPGVVRKIHVEAGQPVEKGVTLVELGPAEA